MTFLLPLGQESAATSWGQAVGSGVAMPRMMSQQGGPSRTSAGAQPAPTPRLTPVQELHRQAYYQAVNAGYSPAQARAHADAIVAQQQPHLAQEQAQAWERYRIAQQQQSAAARQNDRLWQSLQQQRGQIQAQGPRGPQPGAAPAAMLTSRPNPTAPNSAAPNTGSATMSPRPSGPSAPSRLEDAEARGVKAASAQLARVQARGQRIEPVAEFPASDELTLTPSSTAARATASVPSRLAGNPPAATSVTPPRSVLESGQELELIGPQGVSNDVAVLPGPVATTVTAGLPATPSARPAPLPGRAVSPSATSAGTPTTPAAPAPGMRAPRKLPQVDPQPLQAPKRELELELEGFTDELLNGPPATAAPTGPHRQIGYQQPLDSPSYASQDYAPRMTPGPTGLPAVPPSLAGGSSVSLTQRPSVGGLAIEPMPVGNERIDEVSYGNPNGSWQEDGLAAPQVPPPAGIRVTPVATGGRRVIGSARGTRAYQDDALDPLPSAPEPMPAPRQELDLESDDVPGLMKSCAELKQDLLGITLRDISLDLSTPVSTLSNAEATLLVRDWRDNRNSILARGRATSASSTEVQIEDEAGLARTLSLAELSARDQKYAWDMMNLPFECGFGGTAVHCRSFAPAHVSWHASNLCHKPLYFEDIQLERYGHTVGPIRQPVKSAAKFLVQAALLPYQMALHPPNECQYPLGLFRPGNCAPYLRTPFPWERRAIGYQAGVATGLFLLVP